MREEENGTALLERIILEIPQEEIVLEICDVLKRYLRTTYRESICIPKDATRSGVPTKAYDVYRLGLVSACADVVCVRDTNGKLEVPLIARAKPPFQGGWWMQGGAIFNFRSVSQFLFWKLFREAGIESCGIKEFAEKHNLSDVALSCKGVQLVGEPLGVYRTAAEDSMPGKVCDTLNIAYLALWPAELPFGHDDAHTAIRWVTLPELKADQNLCGHWYPQRLATRALQIVGAAMMLHTE